MANMLVSTGVLMNLLARGTVSVAPAMDAVMGQGGLVDYDPGIPARFSANVTTPVVNGDIDLLGGIGGFETFPGGLFPGWVVDKSGAGTAVNQNVAGAHIPTGGGSGSLELVTPVSGAGMWSSVRYDYAVRSGERLQVRAYLQSDTVQPLKVRVQNLHSGKYLTNAGAWQTAVAEVFSQTSSGWVLNTRAFNVESRAALAGLDTATLRITVRLDGAAAASTVWADRVEVIPATTALVVVGHNLDPIHSAFEVVAADSADYTENQVTPATAIGLRQPAFYAKWAETFRRFYNIRPNSTANSAASGPVWYGEVLLLNPLVAARSADWPIRITSREPQVRNRNGAGGVFVLPQGRELHTITLPFSYRSLAQYEEARDEILRRGRYGFHPTVLIPLDDQPEVFLCRKDESDWSRERSFARTDASLTLEEMAIAEVA